MRTTLNGLVPGFEQDKTRLIQRFQRRRLDRSGYLLHAGERWAQFSFVERGLLRLVYTSDDGKEFNKGFFSEGHMMGPIAPSGYAQPSRFAIQALEPVELRACDLETWHATLEGTLFGEQLLRRLAQRLADEKVVREAEFLLDDASTRYRSFLQRYPDWASRISQRHIASYLGITEVSLSRLKRQFSGRLS